MATLIHLPIGLFAYFTPLSGHHLSNIAFRVPYITIWHPVALGSLSCGRLAGGAAEEKRSLDCALFQAPCALRSPLEQAIPHSLISSSASFTINSFVPLQPPYLIVSSCMLWRRFDMFIDQKYITSACEGWTSSMSRCSLVVNLCDLIFVSSWYSFFTEARAHSSADYTQICVQCESLSVFGKP